MTKQWLASYGVALVVMLAIDIVWLFAMRGFYASALGTAMRERPILLAAILFYVVYAAGLATLVIVPSLDAPPLRAVMLGGLLGLVAYGTYDFTNHATLTNFPLRLLVVDLAWGTIVSGVVAGVARLVVPMMAG